MSRLASHSRHSAPTLSPSALSSPMGKSMMALNQQPKMGLCSRGGSQAAAPASPTSQNENVESQEEHGVAGQTAKPPAFISQPPRSEVGQLDTIKCWPWLPC